jgi:RHS repeat-associated protein
MDRLLGYFKSAGVAYAEYSVRARLYSSKTGLWVSTDPGWPVQEAYNYAMGSPVLRRDPRGLDSEVVGCCYCADGLKFVAYQPVNGTSNCKKSLTNRVGDYFNVHFNMGYYAPKVPPNNPVLGYPVPRLSWFECANEPLSSTGPPAGQWCKQDISKSACPSDYRGLQYDCKSAKQGNIYDEPSMNKTRVRNLGWDTYIDDILGDISPLTTSIRVRNLWIYIKLAPDPECTQCGAFKFVKVFQSILWYAPPRDSVGAEFQQGWPTNTGDPSIDKSPCNSVPPDDAPACGT